MKHNIQLSVILLAVYIISSCGNSKEDNKAQATTVKHTTDYKFISLESRQITGTVQLPGVMQPFEFVQIFPKVNGFVKDVYVDRGSVVHKGQVLITLQAPEIEEQVAAAKLRYSEAHAVYLTSKDRYKRLLETSRTPGTISPYDLSAAESKMLGDSATAQGQYANYKAQVAFKDYLTVTAPFDGVITERDVHPGALVGGAQNNKPMLVLQQASKLRLVVSIPEQYSTQISNNSEVHYTVNALPGQDFIGKVSRSSQSLSNNFRSETIEIDVPNSKNTFKPGMYAEVTLPVSGSANAYVIPKSAIVTTTERKYIVMANDNKAKFVDVSEGNQDGDSTEIFGDLHTGDRIIANPSYQIKDGQTIQ